ncbi:MAG: Ig-like domain repeat protein [Burkholderiales bacterium]
MIRTSSMQRAGDRRWTRLAVRLGLAAVCAIGLMAPVPAALAADFDALVVRFRDDAAPGATMPTALQDALLAALGTSFTVTGRTTDGAFRVQLGQPLDLDTVRAAMNRVRLDPTVVYAGLAPGPAVPDTTGRPTDRLIVKYRDPTLANIAKAGLPLGTDRIDQLTALAGVPIAWRRGMHDGANVLQMLQRLPIAEVEAIAARIAQSADIEYAQPDYIRTAQIVPTDPCYASASVGACNTGYQWDLFDPTGGIGMPAAWDITTGSAAINVAVIDTGALFNHPDLAGRFVGGYDMIADCAVGNDGQPGPCTWSLQQPDMLSRDTDASDPGDWITSQENTGLGSAAPPYNWFQTCGASNSSWHGTHVAGTIGAVPNNGIGIAGINWVSKIVPVRVLGKCGGYTSDIAAAIVWAAGGSVAGVPANANPARVLSISLGGGGSCDSASQSAITTATSPPLNAVVVVAAGNNNGNAANFSPASCNGVITVAATIKNGTRARYSNYGAVVEIAAPGGNADGVDPDILSTINSGTTSPNANGYIYERYAGTSMATPHVSGVASLMLSANPSLTPAQVLSKIQTTARVFPTPGPACNPTPQASACNCTTALCGSGILNAAAAVASAATGTSGTTLASSANPAALGANVTFTATVTGNNPTGTVNFKDNGVSLAGCSLVGLVGSGNLKTAQCSTSTLTAGSHPIVATYSGDGSNPSTSSTTLSQSITTPPGTTLTSSLNPANAGQLVTLTAFVTGSNPVGTVTFKDGAANIAACVNVALTGSGNTKTAACPISSLAAGTHSLTAAYTSGDRNNASSTSAPLSQVINGGGQTVSSTAVIGNPNPSTVGTQVTFTATVTGTNPTGNVDFKDGATTICSGVALSGGGNTPSAQCQTSLLTQGTHSITASYAGNAGNTSSVSPALSQVVNPAPTVSSTAVVGNPNPSTVGTQVTFTATVTGTNPTGNVDFKDGATTICSGVALSGGGNTPSAQCQTSLLTQGTHSITASYAGNAGNTSSVSPALSQVVNAAAGTVVTLGSAPNPSTAGAFVTFTANVNGINPTGTVNFKDGAVSIAGCALQPVTGSGNMRTASCISNVLTQGVHSVTAVYSGDGGNPGATSNTLTQTVNACVGRGC